VLNNSFEYKIGSLNPSFPIHEILYNDDPNKTDLPYISRYVGLVTKVKATEKFYFTSDDTVPLGLLIGNHDPSEIDMWWNDPSIYTAVKLHKVEMANHLYYGFFVKNKYIITEEGYD
jgi:hypothetical protein